MVAHLGGVVAYESYQYDAAGNRVLMKTPWGSFTYTYDARNQMTVLQDPGYALYGAAGGRSTWTYDGRGLITREDWPNGTHATVTYDPNGRALQVRHATSANAEVERAFYSYDSLGNPLFKDTATGRYTYTYDAANQLTSEWNQAGRTTWTYDAGYRRATQRTLGSLANTTYTFDAADELLSSVTIAARTTFSYDPNGQTTKVQPPAGNPTTYAWDGAHRLKSAITPANQRFSFTYDQDGLRIQKVGPSGTDSFLWDGQDVLFWTGPNAINELTSKGATLARITGHRSGSVNLNRQYHTDALANVEAVTDASQTAEVKPATDAWGNLLSGSATDQPYDFTGGLGYWHDPDLGLQYVRARWLNPSTGQWMSPDPVESEPRYSYAHQMPTTKVDPSGRQTTSGTKSLPGLMVESIERQETALVAMLGLKEGMAALGIPTNPERTNQAISAPPHSNDTDEEQEPNPNDPVAWIFAKGKQVINWEKEQARESLSRTASNLAKMFHINRKTVSNALTHILMGNAQFLLNWWRRFYSEAGPLTKNLLPDLDPNQGDLEPEDIRQFVHGFADGLVDGLHDFVLDLASLPFDLIEQVIDLFQFVLMSAQVIASLTNRAKRLFAGLTKFTTQDLHLPDAVKGRMIGLLLVAALGAVLMAVIPGPEGKGTAASRLEKVGEEASKVERALSELGNVSSEAESAVVKLSRRAERKKNSVAEIQSSLETEISEAKAPVLQGFSQMRFRRFARAVRQVAREAGLPKGELVAQGSRVRGKARTRFHGKPVQLDPSNPDHVKLMLESDVDVALRVDSATFDEFARRRLASVRPGTRLHATLQSAAQKGKLSRFDISPEFNQIVRSRLIPQVQYDIDFSIIKKGSEFDTGPFMPLGDF